VSDFDEKLKDHLLKYHLRDLQHDAEIVKLTGQVERQRAALEVHELVIDRLMKTQSKDAFVTLDEMIEDFREKGLLDGKALNPDD